MPYGDWTVLDRICFAFFLAVREQDMFSDRLEMKPEEGLRLQSLVTKLKEAQVVDFVGFLLHPAVQTYIEEDGFETFALDNGSATLVIVRISSPKNSHPELSGSELSSRLPSLRWV